MTVEQSIIQSIEKNGFPKKQVRLPFKPIFEACKKEGKSLSAVLKDLQAKEIQSEIESEKILFFSSNHPQQTESAEQNDSTSNNPFGIPDWMVKEGMERMKTMDPKVVQELKDKFMGMSPEERQDFLKQAGEFLKDKKD